MIVEGLLTSTSTDGVTNVAPMGPIVHGDFESLTLRPFAGSTTFDNLTTTRVGVFHVVDRVQIIAAAAIRRLTEVPDTFPARKIAGAVLSDCCRWLEFEITDIDCSSDRSVMRAKIVHSEVQRPFFGFNRARHAVIEAAILATRVHLLPRSEIATQLGYLKSSVEKTGGTEETAAFRMLQEYMLEHWSGVASA
ncbi:MAG: DUF447 family protein [Fuerstiella sp.]